MECAYLLFFVKKQTLCQGQTHARVRSFSGVPDTKRDEVIDLNQHIHCGHRHWLEHNCLQSQKINFYTSAPGIAHVKFLQ